MVQLKLLELFAGSRSVGRVAERMGMEVCSVDIEPFDDIDVVKDVEALERADIPFIPDVIWASPPCTTYSIAAISHHRQGTKPISEFAVKSDRLLAKTLLIASWFPEAKVFVENPVGMMRKLPMMQYLERVTITYCSYGDGRMKPTDIWTNHLRSMFNPFGWKPRARCENGEGGGDRCHHENAPRGAKTGTQGLNGAYNRSKIPPMLIKEMLQSCFEITNNACPCCGAAMELAA